MKAKLCATAAQQPPWSLCSPPAPRRISTKKKHTHKKRSCFFACCKRICWILPKASTPFWQSISAGRRNRNSAASCQMKDKKDFFFFLFLFPLFYGIKRPHKKKKQQLRKDLFICFNPSPAQPAAPLHVSPTSSHADGKDEDEGCSVQELPGCSHLPAQLPS